MRTAICWTPWTESRWWTLYREVSPERALRLVPQCAGVPRGMWIIAPEVVQQFGDVKKAEAVIGTGLPYWSAMSRTSRRSSTQPGLLPRRPAVCGWGGMVSHPGRIDGSGDVPHRATRLWPGDQLGRAPTRPGVAQEESSTPAVPGLSVPSGSVINMRTDMPPFNDVRVRRAISHAIDRQALIEAVWGRGAPTAAVSRGLVEWSVPIDQLGAGRSTISTTRRSPAPAGGSRVSQGV